MCRTHLAAALTGILFSTTAASSTTVPWGYRNVATEYGIPPSVLYAIALTESGRSHTAAGARRPWPWTLNVAGQGHVYPSRAAAWKSLSGLLAQGERSIDIGLMQVNWRFHRHRLGDAWQALAPYHNLRVAAAILRECYTQRRDWWASVGCYHAPHDAGRAQRYRMRVVRQWQRLVAAG